MLRGYFKRYKSFLQFLGLFFLTYVVLTLCYQYYLGLFKGSTVDGFTEAVSSNAAVVLQFFTDGSYVVKNPDQDFIKLIYKGSYVAKIIEGCNAMSVIILFTSFVIAFSGRIKPTVTFIIIGSVVIYVLNIFRIALLSALIYYHPDQEPLLHGVIFPLYIYGVVCMLWMYWVQKYSKYASKKN